ncbi:MAG TPA: hypothetical protein VFA55_01985, partial [Candidatus Kapabacteria bacterium]|nr:hypothetical protein [Candidatus Kapabacteria bacterium]
NLLENIVMGIQISLSTFLHCAFDDYTGKGRLFIGVDCYTPGAYNSQDNRNARRFGLFLGLYYDL